MIAAIELPDKLCPILWVGRQGLRVRVKTYCGQELDAGRGVVQVPDSVLAGHPFLSVSDFEGKGRRPLRICSLCQHAIRGP